MRFVILVTAILLGTIGLRINKQAVKQKRILLATSAVMWVTYFVSYFNHRLENVLNISNLFIWSLAFLALLAVIYLMITRWTTIHSNKHLPLEVSLSINLMIALVSSAVINAMTME
jgi:hypothetical protein